MTQFEARLIAQAEIVNDHLSELLSDISDMPDRLGEALRLAVMGGGKRFRPFLVAECAALFDVPAEQAVTTGSALELLHCYSLVHDDLPAMDNDRLRRGKPSVWAAFDEWTAILAGDALLTLAFEILAQPSTSPDPAIRSELIGSLAKAAGPAGMVGGQMLDLASDKLGEPPQPSLDHVRCLQAKKTGALIRFACEAGAILGKAPDAERQALGAYGGHLGIVFQIADDLLDATGDSANVGKTTGKDEVAGKATQISLLGIDAARTYLDEVAQAAIADLAPFGDRASVLAGAVTFAAARNS